MLFKTEIFFSEIQVEAFGIPDFSFISFPDYLDFPGCECFYFLHGSCFRQRPGEQGENNSQKDTKSMFS